VPAIGWVLLGLAAAAAVTNWWAVDVERKDVEFVAKPATLVLLIVVALVLDPGNDWVRAWFVVALVLCLAGDVLLMVPGDHFVPGLAAFLAGHVAYVVGFWVRGVEAWALLLGLLVVAITISLVARPIVASVQQEGPSRLVWPVLGYIVVISVMVASAVGTTIAVAIVGASLFYASDALLAWNRFVQPLPNGRVLVMVTYHLAQAALVLSLVG
jgi:alkenylglycerophosphocholine/alkenylglycerophosphoethanolamine hydrolase